MKAMLWAMLAQASMTNQVDNSQPIVLEPLSEWILDQGRQSCAVRRSFGAPGKPTVVEFRRDEPMNGGFDIAITSGAFAMADGPFQATLKPGGVAFSPSMVGRERASTGAIWSVWKHDIREASKRDISKEEWDRYYAANGPDAYRKRVETLEVESLFDSDLVLPIGPIDGLRQQLTDCYDAVMMANGLTRDDARENHRPVEFRNRQKIMVSMLPLLPQDIRQRIQERKDVFVEFVVFLDANAEPTSCRLSTVPRYRELEKEGCETIVREGQFRLKKGEEARPAMIDAGYHYREDLGLAITGR